MKMLASLPLLAALALPACGSKPQIIAVQGADPQTRHPGAMTVTGTAHLEVSPDCADLTMTISEEAARPGLATHAVQAKEDAVVAKLRGLGVDTKDLKLSGLDLEPEYEPEPLQQWITHLKGFRAQITITATTKDFSKLPALMEAGADAGVTTMSSQFRRSDLDQLKRQLRDSALTAARAKADQTAKGLGITLGPIVSVSESAGGQMWSQEYFPQANMPQANSVQVMNSGTALGGTLQPLTLEVTIGYELAVET